MNTLAPKAKIISKVGESLLFESNSEHTNTYIPRTIPWNRLLNEKSKGNLENMTNPLDKPNNRIEPSILSNINEYSNGLV